MTSAAQPSYQAAAILPPLGLVIGAWQVPAMTKSGKPRAASSDGINR